MNETIKEILISLALFSILGVIFQFFYCLSQGISFYFPLYKFGLYLTFAIPIGVWNAKQSNLKI